jgi:hypothetical protein
MMRLSAAFTRLWVLVDAPASALVAEEAKVSSSKLSMSYSFWEKAGRSATDIQLFNHLLMEWRHSNTGAL